MADQRAYLESEKRHEPEGGSADSRAAQCSTAGFDWTSEQARAAVAARWEKVKRKPKTKAENADIRHAGPGRAD